jgi:hypothetical protein
MASVDIKLKARPHKIYSIACMLIIFCSILTTAKGLDLTTQDNEPQIIVSPGSDFNIGIPLLNPDNSITGNYAIIQDSNFKTSMETALTKDGFQIDWTNRETDLFVRSEGQLARSWKEQVGEFFKYINYIKWADKIIRGRPPSPSDIATAIYGTPPDWALKLGDKYRDSNLQMRINFIQGCMKDPGFWLGDTGNTKRIQDGILVPPTCNLLLIMPLKAPLKEGTYDIETQIPYYYTTEGRFSPVCDRQPQCLCFKIRDNTFTWKKTIVVSSQEQTNDLSTLTKGVTSICPWGVGGTDGRGVPGLPGPVEALSDKAVPIASGDDDTTPSNSAVGIASFLGDGRIIALGHDGFFINSAMDLFDNRLFGDNIIDWLNGKDGSKKILVTTGHGEPWVGTSEYDSFFAELESRGYTITKSSEPITPQLLSDVSVLFISIAWKDVSDSEISAITDYVSKGGGLYLAGLGWAWKQYNDPNLDAYPMNKIGSPFGVRWIDGYISDPTNNYEGAPLFHTFYS